MTIRIIKDAWNKFFFEPRPTESIALFRIVWGLILAAYLICELPNLSDFYGPHALLSLSTVRAQFPFAHANLFHLLSGSYEAVYFLVAVYALGILGTILGFYTRTSLIIVLLCMTSFHQRNIWLLSSSECLMRIMTLYLVCSPCGNSMSIDRLLKRELPREWSPWVLRLIQIQLSVVYLWTVWHKLKGDNWFDGSAVYYATRVDAMKNFPVPYLLDNAFLLQLMTWGTLLLETALGTLIWFKEYRRKLILAGLAFHFGIEWMMSIPFFEINMAALLILFFTPEEVREFVQRKKHKFRLFLEKLEIDPVWKLKIIKIASE